MKIWDSVYVFIKKNYDPTKMESRLGHTKILAHFTPAFNYIFYYPETDFDIRYYKLY